MWVSEACEGSAGRGKRFISLRVQLPMGYWVNLLATWKDGDGDADEQTFRTKKYDRTTSKSSSYIK